MKMYFESIEFSKNVKAIKTQWLCLRVWHLIWIEDCTFIVQTSK